MSEKQGLEGLLAWRRSMDFAKCVYQEVIPLLPKEEKWAMGSQLRRAVASIPANIAEGYGRHYYQEGVRFCYIARGSLEETFTLLTLAQELGFIKQDLFKELKVDMTELKRIIQGYIGYLKKSKRGENEPGSELSVHEVVEDYLIYDETAD